MFDAVAGGKQLQRSQKFLAAQPLAERHAGFTEKNTFHSPAAGPALLQQVWNVGRVAGEFGETKRARVGGGGQLERDGLKGLDFIANHVVQMFMLRDGGIERTESNRSQNQFAHERGHIDYGTCLARPGCLQIKHPYRDFAVHFDLAGDACGNENCAVRGDGPGGVFSPHGHHAAGGVDQLVPTGGGRWHDSVEIIAAEGDAEGSDEGRAVRVVT